MPHGESPQPKPPAPKTVPQTLIYPYSHLPCFPMTNETRRSRLQLSELRRLTAYGAGRFCADALLCMDLAAVFGCAAGYFRFIIAPMPDSPERILAMIGTGTGAAILGIGSILAHAQRQAEFDRADVAIAGLS